MNNTPVSKSYGTGGFLIASSCLLLLLSFVKPITVSNGWGRETISIARAVQNL